MNPTPSLRRSSSGTPRPIRLVVAFTTALVLVQGAFAADDNVFNVSLFAAQRYDSNLFKIPDDQQPFGNGRRSATTTSTGLALQAVKTYGLQTFDLDLNVTHDHYSPYNNLDTTGRVLSASWAWTFTSALAGNLSIAQTEVPNNFSDTGVQTSANKRKTEERRFDVNARPGAAFHPRFSFIRNEDKSEQITIDRTNSATTSIEAALVYELRTGNTAEIYFRRGRGNYTDLGVLGVLGTAQNASNFDERETGARAHWIWSGASTFDGRIGYLERTQNEAQFNDVRGPVGNLSFTYALTGKTSAVLSASRNLTSAQSLISTYSQDETLSVTPTWAATSKLTFRPSYSLTNRTFKGALVPVSDDLRMTMRDTTLQLDYAVLRALSLSFQIFQSTRSSNDRTFQYRDHGAQVRAAFNF